MFVETGGQWDNYQYPEKIVETDLMLAGRPALKQVRDLNLTYYIAGSYDIPLDLQAGIEVISAATPLGAGQFPVLNIQHAMTTKLSAFYTRRSPTDYDDIRWMCQNYYREIEAFKTQMNMQHRLAFIQECQQQSVSREAPNFVKRMKHVLGVP